MTTKVANPRTDTIDNDIPWQQTMCILCATNCGIEVQVKDRHIVKVRGDKAHPVSKGYLCQKAARLDHYQNHLRRVKQPLKRMADGSFAQISWDDAVDEIVARGDGVEHGLHGSALLCTLG